MSVYVDDAKHSFRGMKMCHLLADNMEELHGMADKIGMARRWFQNRRVPHYDICQRQRKLAVKAGAVEICRRQMVELIRKQGCGRNSEASPGMEVFPARAGLPAEQPVALQEAAQMSVAAGTKSCSAH